MSRGFALGRARPPKLVWTEFGLLLLVANQIVGAILQSLHGLLFPFRADLFTYPTDLAITAVLLSLFFVGSLLIVGGRKLFGSKHSEQTLLGVALWISVTLFDLFLLPASVQALATLLPAYAAFAVIGMSETAISVTAVALLLYNLESLKGKILLWLGIIVELGLAVAFDSQNLHLFPYYSNAIQQTILSVIGLSSALFAASSLVALFRVRSHEYLSTL